MSAYDELSTTGRCGPESVALLRRLAKQVTRTGPFPPKPEFGGWSDDAVDDLLADMMEKKGPAFVIGCFTKATDQPSLERLFLAAIRNHLIDEAKGTDRGKLRRRLETILGADARFVDADIAGTHAWTLAGGPTEPWQGDRETLLAAAFGVRGVTITRWNESGPTATDTVAALTTVAEHVLTTAGGAVRDEDVAWVLQHRFALLTPPVVTELEQHEQLGGPAAPEGDAPHSRVGAEQQAEELWASLSQTERSVLPHLGKSGAELALVTGQGPKTSRAIAEALAEKIRLATVDDNERDDVVLFLLQLCQTRP